MSKRTPYELELEKQLAAVQERAKNQAWEITKLKETVQARNKSLDAMHWVWCDGGCASGVHRFDEATSAVVTDEVVQIAVRNTERLARWKQNRAWKLAHRRTGPIGWLWLQVVEMWCKELTARKKAERRVRELESGLAHHT